MRILLALVVLSGLWTGALAQALQQGDTVEIVVLQDPKLNRQIVVGPTGMVSFPLAGHIRAEGLTLEALERTIRAKLKGKYSTDIDVTASLVSVAKEDELKPRIFVTGEVNKPGPHAIRSRTNVLQAIAMSGGFGPFAAKKRVQIRRQVNGTESVFVFDYSAFESGRDVSGNIELVPGDVVVVPERGFLE